MNDDIQLRGHCPHCGRLHAIVNGHMSKHGYDVKHGYFHGVCGGERHAPIEIDHVEADRRVAALRSMAADERTLAARFKSGEARPRVVKTNRYDPQKREYVHIPFEDATSYQQREAVESAVWKHTRFAEMLDGDADTLVALVAEFHGKPLIEVKRADKPAPIQRGERRRSESGRVLTASHTERGRVYWTYTKDDGRVFKGWTGVQSWRKFPIA